MTRSQSLKTSEKEWGCENETILSTCQWEAQFYNGRSNQEHGRLRKSKRSEDSEPKLCFVLSESMDRQEWLGLGRRWKLDRILYRYGRVELEANSLKQFVKDYQRLTIDKLSDEGCMNLLEAFCKCLGEDLKNAYLQLLANPKSKDHIAHYRNLSQLCRSRYFSELTNLDGDMIVNSIEYEINRQFLCESEVSA